MNQIEYTINIYIYIVYHTIYHILSNQVVFYHIISCIIFSIYHIYSHIILYLVSLHIICYHIIWYHASYHSVLYHILYHIIYHVYYTISHKRIYHILSYYHISERIVRREFFLCGKRFCFSSFPCQTQQLCRAVNLFAKEFPIELLWLQE